MARPEAVGRRLVLAALAVTAGPAALWAAPPLPQPDTLFADPRVAALAAAARQGDGRAVRARLAEGADPTARGRGGLTLAQWAVLIGDDRALGLLLAAGAPAGLAGLDGDTALHSAAMADDPRMLARLLRHLPGPPDLPNAETGRTPLFAAILAGRQRQIALLLAAGADPGWPDRMGNTPLHLAAQINDAALALQLLQAGAPAGARNRQGRTFRSYLALTPDRLLNRRARTERQALADWLAARGQSLDGP